MWILMTSMRLLLLLALMLQCGAAQLHDQQQQVQSAKCPWLLHDPGFAVDVRVTPFGDELWTEPHIKAQDELPVLRLPSSLLNVTVILPARRNLTDVRVSISLFKPSRNPLLPGESGEFTVLADTQLQYASSYRIDVSHVADEIVLRVYVEGSVGRLASSDASPSNALVRARAFFVRTIDLRASEAQYHICSSSAQQQDEPQDELQEHHAIPPVNMPRHLCQQYTMSGKVPVRKWYFDDQSDADQSYAPRSFEFIEALIAKAARRESFYYGATDDYLFAALEKHGIRGQQVLIVGSTTPWYESVCVALGAASCTTIDYNRLRYDHPQLRTLTLAEFAASGDDTCKRFDVILSISSFEHDGLGRYGDPLAPDADLEAMRSLLQYAHPSGSDRNTKLFLVVPVGPDCLVWNAQRIYGPLRLPLLIEAWSLIDSFGFQKSDFVAPFSVAHQPVFVLEPHETQAAGHSEEL